MLTALLVFVMGCISVVMIGWGIVNALTFVPEDFHERECRELAIGGTQPDDLDHEFWI